MDRTELARSALLRITQTNGAGLSGTQYARINNLASSTVMSGLDLQWAISLAKSIIDGYHVPDGELRQVTELVGLDGEGYLYFDGIRGDNIGDGVTQFQHWDRAVLAKANDFESRCVTALLTERTVQQRDQPAPDYS